MADNSKVKLKICFNDPDGDEEDREEEVLSLLKELKNLDEVETVERVIDSHPPEGNKALAGFLVGILSAEVSPANIKALFRFLSDRLGGKPIELTVEANGRKLSVKAHSREELEAAIKAAQEFVGAEVEAIEPPILESNIKSG